jgi:hypothetical protein
MTMATWTNAGPRLKTPTPTRFDGVFYAGRLALIDLENGTENGLDAGEAHC